MGIEEVQFDLPWILDLAKNAAIISSKCMGAFISAKIKTTDIFKEEENNKNITDATSRKYRSTKIKKQQRNNNEKKKTTEQQKEKKQKSILSLPRIEAKWL